MYNKKMMLCASVFMLISSISLTGQAADQQSDKSTDTTDTKIPAKVVAKAPIVIDADHLTFSDATGDLLASGHVSIVQNDNKIITEKMKGNSKQTEVWIDGVADFLQPGTKLTGTGTQYNYTQQTGTMVDVKGNVGNQHVAGHDVDMMTGETIIHNGMATKCPAKVPDYRMTAQRIEIWPGDKMIAYDAKFWVGNVVLFTLPKYQTSLKKNAKDEDIFPRVGYNTTDGVSVREHLEDQLSDKVAAYVDLNYYSKRGFEPDAGVIDREPRYSVGVVTGQYEDSNNNWITKKPEFDFTLNSQRLGASPLSYTFSSIYGQWYNGALTSWHQDDTLYFARDPINLSKGLSLNLGTGFEHIHESVDGSNINSFKYDAVLTKQWSPKFSTGAEYHYDNDISAIFSYNAPELARETDLDFTYKIDNKNTITVRRSYNANTNTIFDQDYTWTRDLHCWQGTFTFRAKRNEFDYNLSTTRF